MEIIPNFHISQWVLGINIFLNSGYSGIIHFYSEVCWRGYPLKASVFLNSIQEHAFWCPQMCLLKNLSWDSSFSDKIRWRSPISRVKKGPNKGILTGQAAWNNFSQFWRAQLPAIFCKTPRGLSEKCASLSPISWGFGIASISIACQMFAHELGISPGNS